jgi:hypothetical protein
MVTSSLVVGHAAASTPPSREDARDATPSSYVRARYVPEAR